MAHRVVFQETNRLQLGDLPLRLPVATRLQQGFLRQWWGDEGVYLEMGQAFLQIALPIEQTSAELLRQGNPSREKILQADRVLVAYSWEEDDHPRQVRTWAWLRSERHETTVELRWLIRHR